MRLLFLCFFSTITAMAQPNGVIKHSELKDNYFIKFDGTLKYVRFEKADLIEQQMSFKNGLLVKPEGIIILKTGQEYVLKNGEIFTELGNLYMANDSIIREVKFRQLYSDLEKVKQENSEVHKKEQLLQEKVKLLETQNNLLNIKANLLQSLSSKKEIQKIENQLKNLEREISENDRTLKGLNLSLTNP